jgi:hypothetical protein
MMKNRKIEMSASKRVRYTLAFAMIAAIASGCGQSAYREDEEANAGSDGGGTIFNGGSVGGNVVDSVTGAPVTSDPTANLIPNQQFHFKTIGTGMARLVSGSGSLRTNTADSRILIKLTAGSGLPLSSSSGWNIGFNCQQFTIKVGSVTMDAFVKKANYSTAYARAYFPGMPDPCANAPTVWVGDFSEALAGGPNSFPIEINNAYYDNCAIYESYYGPRNGGCGDGGGGLRSAHSTHPMDARIKVYIDQATP